MEQRKKVITLTHLRIHIHSKQLGKRWKLKLLIVPRIFLFEMFLASLSASPPFCAACTGAVAAKNLNLLYTDHIKATDQERTLRQNKDVGKDGWKHSPKWIVSFPLHNTWTLSHMHSVLLFSLFFSCNFYRKIWIFCLGKVNFFSHTKNIKRKRRAVRGKKKICKMVICIVLNAVFVKRHKSDYYTNVFCVKLLTIHTHSHKPNSFNILNP